jgi:hypothetical protein
MTSMMLVVVCAVGPVWAGQGKAPTPDAAGRWDATFYSDGGTTLATMVLKKDGDMLTGTISSDLGEAPIAGAQKGADVSLSIAADFGNGPITILMTGKLDGDIMTGVADIGGQSRADWGAKRAAATAEDAAPAEVKPAGATALDVSGPWVLDVNTPVGGGNPTVTFKQDGEKLTGHYTGQLGEAPLTGTLKGTEIRFEFGVDIQGTSLTIVYTGTVEKDAMKGTVRLGEMGDGTFTGSRKKG